MTFEINVSNVTTIHDETDGEQNTPPNLDATTDDNGNDIAVASLPGDFATRLVDLGLDQGAEGLTDDAIGAAQSGYNGTNDGLNAFTVSTNGSTVNNLALTDVNGDPLDGLASGLYTIDGNSILLYTDSGTGANDNIVLGVEAGTGDIVFAIYLDENTDLTAGKLWTVQFEAIDHGDAGDGTGGTHDEPLDLTDKLYVTAGRDLEFDLTNAPSGQNLFIMFGDGDISDGAAEVGIIATGRDPADQSAGESITKGDTVNTSQGGGNTTFGINNQMIDEGEGIYFTFVTGPNSNYTVPNLDQNEADIEANIQFGDFLGAKGAEFQVVQLQSGKTATIKITALNGSGEGVDFVNGLTSGDGVSITSVQVFESDGVTPADGVNIIDNDDGTFTIRGVQAGDIILYGTDGDHNRVLIEHAGSGRGKASADFDIGGFKLVQADAVTAEIGSTVVWEDDGPEIDLTLAANAVLQTDDGDLAGGNSGDGTGTDTDSAGVNDLFTVVESAGADGDDGTVYSLVLGANTTTSLVDAATDEAVVLSLNAGVVEGRTETSDELVFTLSVDSETGAVTLEQSRAVEHTDLLDTETPYNDDITGLGVSDAVYLSGTVTDGDGDTAKDSIDISGALEFTDDGPTIDLTLAAEALLQTDDGDLAGGNSGDGTGTDTDSAGVGDLFTVTKTSGADGYDTPSTDALPVVYALELGTTTTTSLLDAATDKAVVLSLNAGVVEGRTETSDELVFTLSVDSETGAVTLEQSRAVEHTDLLDTETPYNDDITGLGVSDAVYLSGTVTDGDGDMAKDSIDISDTLKFTDDGPAVDFSNLVGTVTTTQQHGLWSESAGADQFGSVTVAPVTGDQFDMVNADGVASTGTITDYSFNIATGVGMGILNADFDNDSGNGDESVAFTLTVNNDGSYDFALGEVILPSVTLSTDEGQLPAGGPDPVQTLTFDGTDSSLVFFAVDADTAETGGAFDPSDILPAIVVGEPDLTEAELEADAAVPIGDGDFPFIREELEMNVSTTGIGVGNNVFQGYDPTGGTSGSIDPFDAGDLPVFDESFVINPSDLASEIKVYISKTAGGFLPPVEDGIPQTGATAAKTDYLYFNVYDEDGNSVGPILVTSDMVTDEADVAAGGTGENLWSFNINIGDLALDGDSIDAVQFTMGFGGIKIPKIEVVVRGNAPPNDIFLDFDATLTDADGDSATTSFAIDLYAPDVISDAQLFDYTLVDAGDPNDDAFNVVVAPDTDMQGVEADADLLLLRDLENSENFATIDFHHGYGAFNGGRMDADFGPSDFVVVDAKDALEDITSTDTLII